MQSLTDYLYDLTMEGGHDEETGDVEHGGWYGLIRGPFTDIPDDVEIDEEEREKLATVAGAIVMQDNEGFKYSDYYDSGEELEKDWAEIEASFADDESEEDLA